ncbi:DotA/TraY family protein [Zooshikella marina]|uniref:DotA/TraY family protein n=1 Tax=Zooshikella ganghwensis TaxID=202772 RepID=UPI001BAEC9CE|nr:DotA/TraY family protein [Zooshikella ganghwensis]MBU2708731.1 DotA/TraY family protein [Zooshikella ganghwensis]
MKRISIISLLTFLTLSFFAELSVADPVAYGDIHGAATRSDDKSRQALTTVFGDIVNNPLAGAGSGNYIADIFAIINGVLLVIGAFIAIYVFVRKLGQSAHDGSAFDRQRNSMWGPINLLLGIAFMVPTASGWSLSQLVMLWGVSIMGVGSANLGMDVALDAFAKGEEMVTQAPTPDTSKLAYDLFEIQLCKHSINQGIADAVRNGALLNAKMINKVVKGAGFEFTNGSYSCGGAEVEPPKRPSGFSFTRDQSAYSVTADHNKALQQAHKTALFKMERELDTAAKEFVVAVLRRQANINSNVSSPVPKIKSAANNYERYITRVANGQSLTLKNLANKLKTSLKNEGWMSLGAWYQTFAQANTRVADDVAAKGKVFLKTNRGDYQFEHVFETVIIAYETNLATGPSASDASPIGNTLNKKAGEDLSSVIADIVRAPGEKLTKGLVGLAKNGDTNQVNPIIAFKNLGDYTLVFAEGLTIGYLGLSAAAAVAEGFSIAGAFVAVANAFTSAKDAAIGVFEALGPFILAMISALFIMGSFLSTYVPFIPFITWLSGILSWIISVVVAVVAAPLWALCHILPEEGEGVNSRTSMGYLTLLDVMLRPLLMVIAFFIASIIVVIMGTILLELFGIALSNIQFESITGVVSIILFIGVFISIGVNLIHTSFNLVLILPDKAISMLGQLVGANNNDLGDRTGSSVAAMRNRNYSGGHMRIRGQGGKSGNNGSSGSDGAKKAK